MENTFESSKERLIAEARHYQEQGLSFDLWTAELGWQDWMNEFTSAAEDEEISEAEAKEIDKALALVWELAK